MVSENHAKLLRKYFKHIPDGKKRFQYYSSRDKKLDFEAYDPIPRNDFIKIINNDFEANGLSRLSTKVIMNNIRTFNQVMADTLEKRRIREEKEAAEEAEKKRKEEEEKKQAKQHRRENTKVVLKFTKDDLAVRRETKKFINELSQGLKGLKNTRSDLIDKFNRDEIYHKDYVIRSNNDYDDDKGILPSITLYHHTEAPGFMRKAKDKRVAPSEVPKRIKDDYESTKEYIDKLNKRYKDHFDIINLYNKYKDGKYTLQQKKKISKASKKLLASEKLYFLESDNGFYFLG